MDVQVWDAILHHKFVWTAGADFGSYQVVESGAGTAETGAYEYLLKCSMLVKIQSSIPYSYDVYLRAICTVDDSSEWIISCAIEQLMLYPTVLSGSPTLPDLSCFWC